ncbi:DUF6223 family protein [Micromonospora sp. WMMD718]|uniref:DUF6223 family protein n=1 Tax=unclassified Micromonospora TaxID=2617518 RepID=UPI00064B8E6A|nr:MULTISPECIES: DUF6223 family protein [unclassified Micromonospora]MDG4755310.1 DUF6223 family protein [Micromonospora sp. WMMD718]
MSIRHLLATTVVGEFAPAAHTSLAAGGIGGSGRAGATVIALVGLTSVVVGGLALSRSRRGPGEGRVQALVAAASGLVSLVLSAWHLALTTEGLGSGQGRAGAVAGVALGLIGAVLGGLALARSRRTA